VINFHFNAEATYCTTTLVLVDLERHLQDNLKVPVVREVRPDGRTPASNG
jgi:hypothetical protein